jgi:hypothetical protein
MWILPAKIVMFILVLWMTFCGFVLPITLLIGLWNNHSIFLGWFFGILTVVATICNFTPSKGEKFKDMNWI